MCTCTCMIFPRYHLNKIRVNNIPAKMYRTFNKQLTTLFPKTSTCNTLFRSFSRNSSNLISHEFSSIISFINSFTTAGKYFPSSSNSTVFSLLQSCPTVPHFDSVKFLHGFCIKCGFISWVDVSFSLSDVYLKFGQNENARKVFDEMPVRNREYFDGVISGFGTGGYFEDVLVVFDEMVALGLTPCYGTVRQAIVACVELRRWEKGRWVHKFVVRCGLDRSVIVCNMLISMYAKMGRLDLARVTFDGMEKKDLVSWNSLITRYAQTGDWAEALNIFLAMKEDGNVACNNVTLLGLVVACGQGGLVYLGLSIHGRCIRAGLFSDFRLGTAILDMYAKCGKIDSAEMLFEDAVFEKSLASWNSLISGYSKSRYYYKAVNCFKRMCMHSKMIPDNITLANVIPAYSHLRSADGIRSIHALVMKKGLNMMKDVVLGTAMIDAYGKCSDVSGAEILFTDIKTDNIPCWNAMLTAYYQNNSAHKGLLLFVDMLRNQILPDSITIVLLLQMCGQLGSLEIGKMAHAYEFRRGFSSYLKVENALLDMYIRCKSVENSKRFFRLMNMKNVITWNIMLSGYVKIGSHANTLKVFSEMVSDSSHRPDSVTLISLIQASTVLSSSHGADTSYAFVAKLGFISETTVMNSLLDAYAKNGCIDKARSLFVQMGKTRDQWSWNVMMAGYGMNGQGEKAFKLLNRMVRDGYEPDHITFTALLSACAHSGMVDKGCEYFDMMVNKYKILPDLEHWTCIIDMFGRAGRLEEAYKLIKEIIPSDFHAVWGAFMDACRMYKNIELGEVAGRKLLELSPQNSGYQVSVSNLYASTMRWDEAMKARDVFKDGSLVKERAVSAIKT